MQQIPVSLTSITAMKRLHFPFYFKGKRHFVEIERMAGSGLFRIKQIIPQINDTRPSPMSIDLLNLPSTINADSEILTLKILDGLRALLGKRQKRASPNQPVFPG